MVNPNMPRSMMEKKPKKKVSENYKFEAVEYMKLDEAPFEEAVFCSKCRFCSDVNSSCANCLSPELIKYEYDYMDKDDIRPKCSEVNETNTCIYFEPQRFWHKKINVNINWNKFKEISVPCVLLLIISGCIYGLLSIIIIHENIAEKEIKNKIPVTSIGDNMSPVSREIKLSNKDAIVTYTNNDNISSEQIIKIEKEIDNIESVIDNIDKHLGDI